MVGFFSYEFLIASMMAHCAWNKCDLSCCALYWHKGNHEKRERNPLFPDVVPKHSAQINFLWFLGFFFKDVLVTFEDWIIFIIKS